MEVAEVSISGPLVSHSRRRGGFLKGNNMSSAEDQLDIITGLVEGMLRDYHKNPGMHAVAPHISLLVLWLDIEKKRRSHAEKGASDQKVQN